eukprot:TRINITY_DN773997_c0_g1_i1.p1 TRINITY_DN773997_c0_g1~~TRINITY_DN773997_c0_g1_i1.p1  ORF type:complete len:514 (-),score=122.20 TRINITY_DN773997_c0_g1_i1:359-1843(-)
MEREFDAKKLCENLLETSAERGTIPIQEPVINNQPSSANDSILDNIFGETSDKEKTLKYYTIYASLFMFFSSFLPYVGCENSFLTTWNTSQDYVNDEIYPYGTRAAIIMLIAGGLLAESLRYTPVIITGILGRIIILAVMTQDQNYHTLEIGQVCMQMGFVSQVVFIAYIYHLVDSKKFQYISSWVLFSFMSGYGISYLIGSYVDAGTSSLENMLWISVVSLTISLIFLAKFSRTESNFGNKFIDFGQMQQTLKRIIGRSEYMAMFVSWVCTAAVFEVFWKGDMAPIVGILMMLGSLAAFIPLKANLIERTKAYSLKLMTFAWICGSICLFFAEASTSLTVFYFFSILLFACFAFFQAIFFTETARVVAALSMPDEENNDEELPIFNNDNESQEECPIPPFSTLFILATLAMVLVNAALRFVLSGEASFTQDIMFSDDWKLLSYIGILINIPIVLSCFYKKFRIVFYVLVILFMGFGMFELVYEFIDFAWSHMK